jgi:hypothetical protein
MKLFILLIPFVLYASEPLNDCGQTFEEYRDTEIYCLSPTINPDCKAWASSFDFATQKPIYKCFDYDVKYDENKDEYYNRQFTRFINID